MASQPLMLSLLLGAMFGALLQRSRFCFFCVTRDFLEQRDARGLLGIITALAVGLLGYHAVFGLFVPDPSVGRLPPDAHIGPVSWALALAALAFGGGMTLSGSCISAHLYRLGEGSLGSLVALAGVLIGFGLGFATWNSLFLVTIQQSPVLWLPETLGYGGSLALQLAVLAVAAAWLMHRHRAPVAEGATNPGFYRLILRRRWPTYVGGLAIGMVAVIAYLRVAPLGVTAELGSVARTLGDQTGLLPERLQGLDSFAGCATAIKETVLSENGVFIGGLIAASFGSALIAGDFRIRTVTGRAAISHLGGGILMGWGAMTALGCTVGALLSGIMAGAVSGWVFAIFCFLGLWIGWRVLLKPLHR
ncbi:MAG: YeeE/YedE family protein [Spiribacter sp.]|nr:YeeE/YedE family protein [Spiribacter sp.]